MSAREGSARKYIKDLLQEQIQHIDGTRGTLLSLPKTISNVLHSQACRSKDSI